MLVFNIIFCIYLHNKINLNGTFFLAVLGIVDILKSTENFVYGRVVSRIQTEKDDTRPEEGTIRH